MLAGEDRADDPQTSRTSDVGDDVVQSTSRRRRSVVIIPAIYPAGDVAAEPRAYLVRGP
jgi:hypothetical protein